MADFCFQCSVDLFFPPPGDLEGLCEEGQFARVICEGCGLVRVNHQGWCVSSCVQNHQEPPPAQLEVLRRVWTDWERRSGPLGWVYRLRDRWIGSPWEPGLIHFPGHWPWYVVQLYRAIRDGEPMQRVASHAEFFFDDIDPVHLEMAFYGTAPHQGLDGEEPATTGTGPTRQDDQEPPQTGVVGRQDVGPVQGGET